MMVDLDAIERHRREAVAKGNMPWSAVEALDDDMPALIAEVQQLRARLREAYTNHCGCLGDRWCDDDDQPASDCAFPESACYSV